MGIATLNPSYCAKNNTAPGTKINQCTFPACITRSPDIRLFDTYPIAFSLLLYEPAAPYAVLPPKTIGRNIYVFRPIDADSIGITSGGTAMRSALRQCPTPPSLPSPHTHPESH